MSYKIQFTNQAESDLKAIYSYLIFNLNSPEYAIKHYIIFYSVDEIAELITILRILSYKQEFKLE